MIYKEVFSLNEMESRLITIGNEDILGTNWCQQGYMQEKGEAIEKLVMDLLSLCEVNILRSQRSSALDEVLKIDVVVENKDQFKDVFAFQVKASLTGALIHYEKNVDITYKDQYFRTPWCLIVDGSQTNEQLLNELIGELCLNCYVDFEKIDDIAKQIISSNGERLSIKTFLKLNSKEIRALRLIHNIRKDNKTFFLNTK